MSSLQSSYTNALEFAALRHKDQEIPGTPLPYVIHVTLVAMEVLVAGFYTPGFDTDFAVLVALLHDTVEDTKTKYEEIEEKYGRRVAEAVLALTKFTSVEKDRQIYDSVQRVKLLEKEVWAVKLADRITNLKAPPADWDEEKRRKYLETSNYILNELAEGNVYLAGRLKSKINEYVEYVVTGDK